MRRWATHAEYAATHRAEWQPAPLLDPSPPRGWGWWDLVKGPNVGVLTANSTCSVGGGHLFGVDQIYLPDHCYWYYNPAASEASTNEVTLSATREIDGNALDLTTLYSPNIFHFLYDCLPRLALLQAVGLAKENFDAILLSIPENELAKTVLASMPLPNAPVIHVGSSDVVLTSRSVAPSYPSWAGGPAPWAVHFLREHVSVPRSTNRTRLYVTRRGRDHDLTNIDEIVDFLQGYGFTEYAAGNKADDLALFAAAEAIVAPHGAGLAPLFVCNPDCVFIELLPRTLLSPAYFMIATAVGMRYGRLVGAAHREPSERVKALEFSLDIPDEATRKEVQEHIRQPFTIHRADLEAALDAHGL